jgi:hypothetical protein
VLGAERREARDLFARVDAREGVRRTADAQ